MTEEEWERIRPLAEAEAHALAALEAWGMRNTPTEPRETVEASIQRIRLQHEFDVARRRLRIAMAAIT